MYFSRDNKFKIFNHGNLVLPVIAGGIFMTVSYFMFEQMETGE
jgi:ABC-type Na+ efflux pump permease subunit